METEQRNKQAVAAFFERISAGDLDGVLAMLADDATWWIAGKPDRLPTAGLYAKPRVAKLLRGMQAGLKGNLKMTLVGAIAEGDQVAAEVRGAGELANGRSYRQEFHFLLAFREGSIVSVREYLDTQHAHDVWVKADAPAT